ncbi:hypothetical protein EV182_003438, partial [Spiromyces aspiralis]
EIDFGYNSRLGADLEAIRALARLIHANRDSLRVLKLDRVGLTDKGLALLVETLVGSTVAGTNTFPLPSLRSLYLRGNRFGTAGISLLSRFLSLPLPSFPGGETRCYAADYHCHCCNSRLEGLYLGYNSTIDPVGLADLATCVQRLPSLRHLGLGAIATTGICYRAPGDTGDHGGEDDGCPGLSELFTALAIHPAVTHLFLPRNSLGDHGIRVLFQALRPNGVLRHLSIACNGITAVGAQHIAEWIGTYAPSSLVTIDLSDNPLGDLGIQRIAAGLAKRPVAGNCATSPADNHHHNRHHQHLCRGGGIPHLRNLVLCACFITDVGVSALASALSSNRSLERINLGYNSRISHKGYHLLCDLAKNNPFLQQIIIGSSPTSIPVTTADHIPVGSSAIAFDDADPIGVLNAILLRNSQHIAHRQEWLGRIVAFVKQHRTCIAAAPVVDASIQLDSMIAAQHGLPLPDNSHQWKEYLGGSFGISYPTDWFTLLQLVLLNSDDDEETDIVLNRNYQQSTTLDAITSPERRYDDDGSINDARWYRLVELAPGSAYTVRISYPPTIPVDFDVDVVSMPPVSPGASGHNTVTMGLRILPKYIGVMATAKWEGAASGGELAAEYDLIVESVYLGIPRTCLPLIPHVSLVLGLSYFVIVPYLKRVMFNKAIRDATFTRYSCKKQDSTIEQD